MDKYEIYKDIATRTGGDIYVGVVGPVRTGKSTFITKFMEELVITNIADKTKRGIAIDELPQSASGKTVMTTEPKFVPSEAVSVRFDKTVAKVRLIDCVGYMVDGALGHEEGGAPRLVSTPWSIKPVPFEKAAEIGTQKVVTEHSTIAVVVTTDGSFTDIPRQSYASCEKRVIKELKSLNKPFIVVFNTISPESNETVKTCRELEKSYGVAVIPCDIANMKKDDFGVVFEKLAGEFPMRRFDIEIPSWMQALPFDGKIISEITAKVKEFSSVADKMKTCDDLLKMFDDSEIFEPISAVNLDMALGTAIFTATAKSGVFFNALGEACEESICDEFALMSYVKDLAVAKREFHKLKNALECAEATGYGIVRPEFCDSETSSPEIVKKAGQYCVRVKAKSKSLHLIRADVETEVDAVCGSKTQCEDFVDLMSKDGFDTEVFGKPVSEMIEEEIGAKSVSVSDSVKSRLKRTVTRAVNERKSNVICILI